LIGTREFFLDEQYVIRDGEIVIVDESTGRIAEGRKWRDGIHQAVEANEGVEVSVPTGQAARITVQDLFLRYRHVAGMTGTASSAAREFRKVYKLNVVKIPTNRPNQRERWDDLVFGSEDAKWDAIVTEVQELHDLGRPVLIGTREFFLDEQYVIRDGEIVIVDESTGRIAEGRKWRDGIHQAVEANEGVEVSVPTGQAARITVQDLFLRYRHVAGMTGTASSAAREFRKVYKLNVLKIPTNRPNQRQHIEFVDFTEFTSRTTSRTCHTRDMTITQKQILYCNPRRLTGRHRNLNPFIRFDRLMNSITPFTTFSNSPR
jgi:preprotein translocase subunit SecA